ncbi:uncharacterized protein LOC131811671 isoform X1 [Mustela lutreola]|uniref:uncharacterized protein LOC131811671 isoform X1 n=1 Tax=Mustela lutreola TaxID=9666 RepID=UPI0027975F43|nr:uncharacterized protein LOC131811671 isoform X1 [Mustela lutreola]
MGSQLHLPLPPPYFAPPPPARQGAEKKALPPGSPALECRLVAKLRISPKYPETRGSARDPWGRRSCLSMRDSSYLFSGVIPCSLQPETPPADSPAGGYNKLFREKHGSWSSFCKAWRCLDSLPIVKPNMGFEVITPRSRNEIERCPLGLPGWLCQLSGCLQLKS